jgi:hypothetical protein
MSHAALYKMWLAAYKRAELPKCWWLFSQFRGWSDKNGYDPEYGYEGKFLPESLLAAKKTPGFGEPAKPKRKKLSSKEGDGNG